MNILFINTHDARGGAALLTQDIRKGMEERGHTTSFFVKRKTIDDPTIHSVKQPNRALAWLSTITKKDIDSIIQNKLHHYLSNDIKFFNNKALLASEELKHADVIHCNNLHNNFFNLHLLETLSRQKPVIWSLHDMWALTPHDGWRITDERGKILFRMEVKPHMAWDNSRYLLRKKKEIYQKSNLHIVSTSGWAQEETNKSILGHAPHSLIYNGIDTELFCPRDKQEARARLHLPSHRKIVTFMAADGKHNPQKGWPHALAIISYFRTHHPDVLFLCIGGTESDVSGSTENIQFIPYISDIREFSWYYAASDIFCNPSLAEAFCMVLVQAMSCGIPVVSFPTGVAPEAITHDVNGFLARYQDTNDMINGITSILNKTEQERAAMGAHSREKVLQSFTREHMIDQYEKLYHDVIAAHTTPHP